MAPDDATDRSRLAGIPRSARYSALAVAVLALAVAHVVPPGPGLFAGAGIGLLGLGLALAEWREVLRRRREADRLLLAIATVPPPGLAWRARELTAPRERRVLARSLRRLADSVERPVLMSPIAVSRVAVSPNRVAVVALADRLAAIEQPVSPRGVVLVRDLIMDGSRSPLYEGDAAGLRDALETLRRAIEPK